MKYIYTDDIKPYVESIRELWGAHPERWNGNEPFDPLDLSEDDDMHRHGLVADEGRIVGCLDAYHLGLNTYQLHVVLEKGYRGKIAVDALKWFMKELFNDEAEYLYSEIPDSLKHSRIIAAAAGMYRYQEKDGTVGYQLSKKLWETYLDQ